MNANDVLSDVFERVRGVVHRTLSDLDADALTWRPDPDANTISWLVWHLTRIQDDHIAEIAAHPQVWDTDAWAPRFGLPEGATDLGYGYSSAQVAAIQPEGAQVLADYHDAVAEQTQRDLAALSDDDYERIIDRSWDPPVTVAVRLVSVVSDTLQHAGQAAYVRGLYERR